MKHAPFFLLVSLNAARTEVGGVSCSFHISPFVGRCCSIDFRETIVNEGAVDFSFVVDLFQNDLAVRPHDESREGFVHCIFDVDAQLHTFFRGDELEARDGIVM